MNPTFRTFRVTFQASGCEPQTATVRVFIHPDGLQVEDAIHLALDDEFGWGDMRRIISYEVSDLRGANPGVTLEAKAREVTP